MIVTWFEEGPKVETETFLIHFLKVSPGAMSLVHPGRSGRSLSPPYSHGLHGSSVTGYRNVRGPHHTEHEFRTRPRPGQVGPYATGPPSSGFR